MTNNTIITKYRPLTWEEVLGNESVIKGLRMAVESPTCPHSYLLTGSSGIGKTTLARIIARAVGASIFEFDAASKSSIDDTRQIVEMTGFRPLDGKPLMIIMDEAHNLSNKAFEPLLKTIEEPPPYIFWALCTTEPEKIKQTIKTRCYPVKLNSLKPQEIELLLEAVTDVENWQVTPSTFQALVQAAQGSARRALSYLEAGHGCVDREELAQVIAEVDSEDSPIVGLCSYLMKGGTNWRQIQSFLDKIENEDNLDSQAIAYVTSAITKCSDEQAKKLWVILEAMMMPRSGWNKKAALVGAVGTILWSNQVF